MGYSTPPTPPPQPLLPLIDEEWRAVPGYEGHYEVSNHGRVKSIKKPDKPLIMSPSKLHHGHRQVCLSLNNSEKSFLVHRLVALVFIGDCPEGYEVNHIDGDSANNHLSNLEYVTHYDNIRHAKDVLKRMGGHNAKLTESDVRHIKTLLKQGKLQRDIAAMYGVAQETIGSINQGINWKHVN